MQNTLAVEDLVEKSLSSVSLYTSLAESNLNQVARQADDQLDMH